MGLIKKSAPCKPHPVMPGRSKPITLDTIWYWSQRSINRKTQQSIGFAGCWCVCDQRKDCDGWKLGIESGDKNCPNISSVSHLGSSCSITASEGQQSKVISSASASASASGPMTDMVDCSPPSLLLFQNLAILTLVTCWILRWGQTYQRQSFSLSFFFMTKVARLVSLLRVAQRVVFCSASSTDCLEVNPS